MSREYLLQVKPGLEVSWEPKFKGQVPIRPDEEEVEAARLDFFGLLDRIHALPVFQGLEHNKDILDHVRQFPEGDTPGKGHLLLRPVGQVILSRAVGQLVKEGHSLEEIFIKLSKWDAADGFTQHTPASIWYGITYDFAGRKMNTRTNENLAARLLAYMVQGANDEERKELLDFVIKARDIQKPDEHVWRDFAGKEISYDPAEPTKGNQFPPPIN
jgi:hypothetical protein